MDLLAHIETFVAVADARSFTAAARTLELPQPLLSRRVKALERSWGVSLFDRAPRRLELTAFGELALPHARDVLLRTRHLQDALAAARTTAVHRLAVPPGCPAAALAAMIRAGAAHGVTIAPHEESAAARREGLAGGRYAAALVRVPVATARLRVATGLAHGGHLGGGRAMQLDALRPRRGASPSAPLPVLRIAPEDDLEPFAGALRRAAARAGLSPAAVRSADSVAAGAAAVLADGGWLVCDRRAARAHGLGWVALADVTLHRGYELAPAGESALARGARRWLEPLLAEALGADEPARASDATGAQAPAAQPLDPHRLTARGS